jgi:S-adenosylmethionine decarboxylase proenzyme
MSTAQKVVGLHQIANIETNKNKIELLDMAAFEEFATTEVAKNNLTMVAKAQHSFSDGGYTCIIALAESHISVHTWPLEGYITLDVFVCNHSKDNTSAARNLFDSIINYFSPITLTRQEIIR